MQKMRPGTSLQFEKNLVCFQLALCMGVHHDLDDQQKCTCMSRKAMLRGTFSILF